ncbi:protein translocase subunit SecY [Sphaerisporangium melleum]|uniref:Protein translocase subunit SecY n=1 Tax=Sphaerisporangium melleum TaxID=321316 RepID=A0A917VHH7_9ACTN|nr:preprotein translocase subunit SecY [Sphaerisporangium melleum]GGK77910.1 protein translocase subunit SecY [Sphaerisporangium melleum]GII71908.1 protein translocase subunit SecY [Sphaerisporangium melleum]
MLTAITRAFRTPDLRNKLLFTLGIIVLFRLGSVLPTPGVNTVNVQQCLKEAQAGDAANIYGMVQLFSGGALLKLSVFALGIMPYITSSIILQLLTVVIPRLEALKKEGQSGTAKITQYTRYLTIGLAVLQSTAFVALARTGQLFPNCRQPLLVNNDVFTVVTMVVVMTAGTSVIMWLGELVTDRGVGNGMSILIFTQVIAVFPSELLNIFRQNAFTFVIVMLVGVFMIAAVVFVEQAQRRVPVQYAKRMVGRRMYGGTSTYIPLKVNQAGIIPVIFASSLLYLPQLLVSLFGNSENPGPIVQWLAQNFVRGDHPVYMVTFFVLIIFFTYFYVSITFNPVEVADNMKKYGGFIPGIRPGRPTAEYLNYVLMRLTAPGSLYLGLISMVPIIALVVAGASQNFPFGGTSILIMVGVGLDTVKQIESQLQQRNYEGFLK